MTPPPLQNCTEQQHLALEKRYGGHCKEGYCRVIPTERLFCHCNNGWKGAVCDVPDDYMSMAGTGDINIWPILFMVLLMLVIAVLTALCLYVIRRGTCVLCRNQQGSQATDASEELPMSQRANGCLHKNPPQFDPTA